MKHLPLAALALSALLAAPASAQMDGMDHSQHMAMDHGAMDDEAMDDGMTMMTEPGQGAFAAIGEIVAALMADPDTDWSRVDIDGLRAHLVDMDLVTTQAVAEAEEIDGGLRFIVHGVGDVVGAVQRMVLAHADFMDGTEGWRMRAETTEDGAMLEVTVPEGDRAKLAGLGFFGVMAWGMHHQAHHWAMATGGAPHQ